MAKMTKDMLRDGWFGKCGDGSLFVIAGGKLVYQDGLYDDFDSFDDDLKFIYTGNSINTLYAADCFDNIVDDTAKVLWQRCECGKCGECGATEEKPKGAITITADQFLEAVKTANDKFMEISKENPGNELVEAIMGIQNLAFGALIGEVLFNSNGDVALGA